MYLKNCDSEVNVTTIYRYLDKLEKEIAQYKKQDEDVLTYALFPQVAMDFFKYREAQETGVDATLANTENKTYPV